MNQVNFDIFQFSIRRLYTSLVREREQRKELDRGLKSLSCVVFSIICFLFVEFLEEFVRFSLSLSPRTSSTMAWSGDFFSLN